MRIPPTALIAALRPNVKESARDRSTPISSAVSRSVQPVILTDSCLLKKKVRVSMKKIAMMITSDIFHRKKHAKRSSGSLGNTLGKARASGPHEHGRILKKYTSSDGTDNDNDMRLRSSQSSSVKGFVAILSNNMPIMETMRMVTRIESQKGNLRRTKQVMPK
jgi:hypothetical protein